MTLLDPLPLPPPPSLGDFDCCVTVGGGGKPVLETGEISSIGGDIMESSSNVKVHSSGDGHQWTNECAEVKMN